MSLNPIPGSPDDDYIDGTAKADLITAGAGNDQVSAEAGNDKVYGEDGDDKLFGSYGFDTLFGGAGNDTLTSSDYDSGQSDHLYGGAGNDLIYADDATDYTFGGAGDDEGHIYFNLGGSADGGAGIDTLHMHYIGSSLATTGVNSDAWVTLNGPTAGAHAGSQSMTLSGFEMLDITTYSGNDTVQGGSLGDRIDVFSGSNWVAAGAGDDLVAYRVEGLNHLDGGTGEDVIRIQSADGFGSALQITVHGTSGTDGQGSVLTGFEHWTVRGNNLNDWAQLGSLHDVFRGFDGDDTCYGMGGGDWISGGYGADMLFGGAGRDQVLGGRGQDTLTGGAGADSFHFGRIGGVGDVITDMVSGEDTVVIDAGLTLNVLLAGRVDDSHFSAGVAQGLEGQFVYRAGANPGSADLIWDANGSDAGGDLLIATFTNQPGLVAGDLLIV